MNVLDRYLARKLVAACLTGMLAAPLSYASALPLQQPIQEPTAPAPQTAVEIAKAADLPEAPAPQAQANPDEQQPPASPANQPLAQKPVGTAAAPVTRPSGVAGSKPAGAAIAPAKQRRVRRILIRVGILVGAGVAVGTVVALSRGSSSRP